MGDLINKQAAKGNIEEILEYLDTVVHPLLSPEHWNVYSELHDMISCLPSAELGVLRCKDCEYYHKVNDWYECYLHVSWCSEHQSCGFAKWRRR